VCGAEKAMTSIKLIKSFKMVLKSKDKIKVEKDKDNV
jgi:hypothetical protein